MPLVSFAQTFAILAAFGTGIMAIASCGTSIGNAACASQGRCPGDKAATADDVKKCTTSLSDPICGPKYQAVINCFLAKEVCTADGGDPLQTLAACSAEFRSYLTCSQNERARVD